jgi:hypothetical protein
LHYIENEQLELGCKHLSEWAQRRTLSDPNSPTLRAELDWVNRSQEAFLANLQALTLKVIQIILKDDCPKGLLAVVADACAANVTEDSDDDTLQMLAIVSMAGMARHCKNSDDEGDADLWLARCLILSGAPSIEKALTELPHLKSILNSVREPDLPG